MQKNRNNLLHKNRTVSIRKRSSMHWLVYIVALWSFLMNLTSLLPNPLGYIKYLPDGVVFLLLLLNLKRSRLTLQRKTLSLTYIACVLFVYTLLVYLLHFQSVAYYLWGFRNNFRFFIAFFAFISFIDKNDINNWLKILDVLFWVNLLLAVFQFFVLGVSGDYLGGIFGSWGKTNGCTMAFLCIAMIRSFLRSFQNEEKMSVCILKSVGAVVIAAMAEIKAFYVLFIIILIGAALLTRFSWKKCAVLLMGYILLMLGSFFLSQIHGFEGFFSWRNLLELATKENYASQNDINRLSAISSLSETLALSPLDRIFGLGLGNCDTSAFAVCNTPFYRRYGYLHYTWLTSAMVFLEMGYVGLVAYIGFFVTCGWKAYKMQRMGIGNRLINQQAFLMSMICLILMFYNSSLRIESAYMMYFILALPFMKTESRNESFQKARGQNV